MPEPESLPARRTSNQPFNIPGKSAVDDTMVASNVAKGPKQNFCFYCKTMQSQLPRHLIRKHLNKPRVEEFANLPIKSPERQLLISKIRKEGNFLLLSKDYTTGKIIPVRRPAEADKCGGKRFTTCPSCKVLYTRNNIRHHFPKCAGKKVRKMLLPRREQLKGESIREPPKLCERKFFHACTKMGWYALSATIYS